MLPERRGWIVSAKWYVTFVMLGLSILAVAARENPIDEKGCLESIAENVELLLFESVRSIIFICKKIIDGEAVIVGEAGCVFGVDIPHEPVGW